MKPQLNVLGTYLYNRTLQFLKNISLFLMKCPLNANFFAGYPVSGQKYTNKNFYLNFELFAQLFYFLFVEIVFPAAYPADGTGYPVQP